MVAMVAGALVLAGLGTLGLSTLDSIRQTQTQLVTEARQVGQSLEDIVTAVPQHDRGDALRKALNALKAPLGLEGETVLAVAPDGHLYDLLAPDQPVRLPGGLTVRDVDMAQLIVHFNTSGHRGRLAWAAYLLSPDHPVAEAFNLVVLLTRRAPTGLTRATYWFGVAAAITLLVALVVATRLGYRIARPLRDTEAVTRLIAEGNLDARVPVPNGRGHELVSLAKSVNQMADSLAEAQGAQRRFLMSVSHDLRTPLTSIRGFAEAIADGATADAGHAAGIIGTEARRLERLVGDLLELAKLESGAFSLRLGTVDAGRVAEEVALAFGPRTAELGLALDAGAPEPGLVLCHADPDRLGQVISNLVENALNYATSRVAVRTERADHDGSGACVVVEDDGPGIAAADLPYIFDRLFQSRSVTGRNLVGGSGLGLAIVKELVIAMGGTVQAESPVQTTGGTRVIVTLQPPLPELKRSPVKPSQAPAGAA
jgi:signal transduction histidine kinase